MVESIALDGTAVAVLFTNNVGAADTVKLNSPTSVCNFFGASATILSDPFLISVVMGNSATYAIIDSILNVTASAAVILRDSYSVVPTTISTTP